MLRFRTCRRFCVSRPRLRTFRAWRARSRCARARRWWTSTKEFERPSAGTTITCTRSGSMAVFGGADRRSTHLQLRLDDDVATAEVVIAELGLKPGAKIAYVFDFGDSWRVGLRLTGAADGDSNRYPRIVATEGDAPPQWPGSDEDEDACLKEWAVVDREAARVVIEALRRRAAPRCRRERSRQPRPSSEPACASTSIRTRG